MKNKFELIIFDWDGTLINSIDWIINCLQKAAENCDCPVPSVPAARDVIGLSLDKAMEKLFPEMDFIMKQRLKENYSKIFFSRPAHRDDLFPGVYDMLVELNKAGYRLAVATGKSRNGLDRALKGVDVEPLFCCTRCADETASKPEPKMIHEIIAEMQAEQARTVMVGDSVHDLQMAENAGVSAIAVACGVHTRDRLQALNPLCCLEKTVELLNLI